MPVESASFIKDLNADYPQSGNPKAEGDNHIRLLKAILLACFPNLGGAILRKVDKETDYTVVEGDTTVLFNCTEELELSLSAAATLTSSHMFSVYANGGDVTITPDSPEQINGASSLVVQDGAYVVVYCTGAGFISIQLKDPVNESIKVDGLYLSLSSTNPATSLGYGTWEAFGTGRALVGIDPANTLMDTAGETFGSANAVVVEHTHTMEAGGTHQHAYTDPRDGSTPLGGSAGSGNSKKFVNANGGNTPTGGTHSHTIANAGEAGTNKNYQPSVAIYIWKRTA
ncbi:phage baseplate protein [Methylocaldum sp.]|uniref:phage baseplate protein n=1 Tax=Methylocaldum sp. TaxID=1969727 RepID=UPI002D2676BA|nr:hypothetical protein [Methylocaldum sp.]HYE38154.1 hypothetical protein [Methylocaldum sp.]